MLELVKTTSSILEIPEEEDLELLRELFGEEVDDLPRRAKLFLKVLDGVFGSEKKKEYRWDFALIAAFLSLPELFEQAFRAMDSDLRRAMVLKTYFTGGKVNLARIQGDRRSEPDNKLSSSFVDLFEIYGHGGFPRIYNLVMVGSSFKVFGAIIGNGLLFKDGTGPGHGEYTHTLQWLTVAKAQKMGLLPLQHSVFEIYMNTAGPGTLSNSKLTRGDQPEPTQAAFWQVLVDCFPQTLSEHENPLENLMSDSYRTPSFLTNSLKTGPLCSTFMAQHLRERTEKRREHFTSSKSLRDYHFLKQSGKGMLWSLQEGVNLTLPSTVAKEFLEELDKRKVKLLRNVGTQTE